MTDKKLQENIGGALRFIVQTFGENSLKDSTHLCAMVSELRPDLSQEVLWLKEALDMGVGEVLLGHKYCDDLDKKIAINKARLIMQEKDIPKKTINFVLDNLKFGLNWGKNIRINDRKIEKYLQEDKMGKEKLGEAICNDEILEEDVEEYVLKEDDKEDSSDENFLKEDDKEDSTNKNLIKKVVFEDVESEEDEEICEGAVAKVIDSNEDLISYGLKNNYIVAIFIVSFVAIMGMIFFATSKESQVYVKDVVFDIDYKKNQSKYVFKKGDFIVMNVELASKKEEEIDKEKLSYEVGDTSICKVTNDFERCRITNKGVGETSINIYYNNRLLKNIDISFVK